MLSSGVWVCLIENVPGEGIVRFDDMPFSFGVEREYKPQTGEDTFIVTLDWAEPVNIYAGNQFAGQALRLRIATTSIDLVRYPTWVSKSRLTRKR